MLLPILSLNAYHNCIFNETQIDQKFAHAFKRTPSEKQLAPIGNLSLLNFNTVSRIIVPLYSPFFSFLQSHLQNFVNHIQTILLFESQQCKVNICITFCRLKYNMLFPVIHNGQFWSTRASHLIYVHVVSQHLHASSTKSSIWRRKWRR